MKLRSSPVLRVAAKLAALSKDGRGLRVSEVRRMLPAGRLPAGVIWELRRWGAATAAVRNGHRVVGWVMVKPLPENAVKANEPTAQTYINYDKGLFLPSKRKATKAKGKAGFGSRKVAKPAAASVEAA